MPATKPLPQLGPAGTALIVTVADIISQSALTHGNIKLVRRKRWPKSSTGRKSPGRSFQTRCQCELVTTSFTELKDAISEISRALIDLGITKDSIFNAYSQTSLNRYVTPTWSRDCGHLFPLRLTYRRLCKLFWGKSGNLSMKWI